MGAHEAKKAIHEFRLYLRDQARTRSASWPAAPRLVQNVALAITADQLEPPIRLREVADTLQINIECRVSPSKRHLGKLIPQLGGFTAVVYGQLRSTVEEQGEFSLLTRGLTKNSTSSTQLHLNRRGRFTVAHEFGHTLFYDAPEPESTPARIVPARQASRDAMWREEGLCDAFARAVLIPSTWRTAVGDKPSFANLIEASSYFHVAGEHLLHRIIHDWKMWDSAIFVRADVRSLGTRYKIFRGSRRRNEAIGPTRNQIMSSIGDLTSPEAVALRLGAMLLRPSKDILIHKNVVWIKM